ncbi:MAG: nucleoside triphosphate pyrophosphatase [Vicinamibacterales bacterium]
MHIPRVLLASASPRRAELLAAAGIPFDVAPADVDETRRPGEAPVAYCERLARTKALAAAERAPDRVVVAADTIVVAGADVFGKPEDAADARRMLQALSGRAHDVLTAVAIAAGGEVRTAVERTAVEFVPLSEDEIAWYVESGEPMDKAGAYAIQGLASRFVARISGSYSNVVGLPVATVYRLLGDIDPRYSAGYPEAAVPRGKPQS